MIGTIDHADRGAGAYHEIIVRPAVDFSRLEEVLVVRTPPASRRRWSRSRQVRSAAALAAILIAIAVQTTLAGYMFRGSSTAIDLVLIVVVYVAIKSGPVTGLLAGTVAGLIQDALSSGILGIGGLAKTMVGFLSGVLGTQFIVTAPLPRFLLLLVATALHAAIFMGLYTLLNLRQFPAPYASIVGQAFGNAFVGVVAFQMIEWFPGFVDRRRAGRFLKR